MSQFSWHIHNSLSRTRLSVYQSVILLQSVNQWEFGVLRKFDIMQKRGKGLPPSESQSFTSHKIITIKRTLVRTCLIFVLSSTIDLWKYICIYPYSGCRYIVFLFFESTVWLDSAFPAASIIRLAALNKAWIEGHGISFQARVQLNWFHIFLHSISFTHS